MASCTVNIRGRELTANQVVEMHLKSPNRFDDVILEDSVSEQFIGGIPLRHQLELAEYGVQSFLMKENVLGEYEQGDVQNWNAKKVMALIDAEMDILFKSLEEKASKAENSQNEQQRLAASYARGILNNPDKFKSLMFRVFINRDIFTIGQGDIESMLQAVHENELASFKEDITFERDLQDSLSPALKFILSTIIPKVKGEERKSLFGYPIYLDMNKVYSELRNILSGTYPDWVDMKEKLQKASEVKGKKWINDFIDTLEQEKNEHLLNEFVSNMTSHPVKMIFVDYVVDKDGNYIPKITESNRNTLTNIILETWYSAALNNNNLFFEEGDKYYIRGVKDGKSPYVLELQEKYNHKEEATREDFKTFFEKLGITFSEDTLNQIEREGFYVGNLKTTFKSFFTHPSGSKKIISTLTDMAANNLEFDKRNIFESNFGGNVMRSLASIESRYLKDVPLTSFRSGTKSLAANVLNRYAKNRERDLKENKGLRDELRKVHFSATNYLIKARPGMPDGLLGDKLIQNDFNLEYPDISALYNDKELKNLTTEEHIQLTLDLFVNNSIFIRDSTGKTEYRSARFLGLTLSDKKLKYVTQLPLEIINNYKLIDKEGNLRDEVINYLYDTLFIPEYSRIKFEEGISERNIEGYNEGRYKFFVLQDLNLENEEAKEALYYKDGDRYILKEGLDLKTADVHAKEFIKNKIRQIVGEDINAVRTNFKENNIKVPTRYIEEVAKRRALGENATEDQIFNLVTADFAIANIIANMTTVQLFSGDPAMAWKKDLDTSMDNYIKRLAKDAAPGIEIADTRSKEGTRNKYRVLFAEDDNSPSEHAEYYNKFTKGYGKITKTDGAGFIAMDEWAHILFNMGKINKEDRDRILQAYEQEEELPAKLKARIPNVFKPVIVADKIENGVERKVYLKFAFYPLLPEMTRAFPQMEKIRKLMKKKNADGKSIQMIVFKSAAKLGATKSRANLFTEEPTFDESNVLELDRYGFKIQQEIPTKLKNTINRGTQFTKMIFNNFRDIEDIKNLEKEHDELYNQLISLKSEKLSKEILNKDGSLNFSKLNNIIKKELVERKYDDGTIAYFSVEDEDFAYPFYANPQKNRIEAIITAIVDSRVRKIEFPGSSHVLIPSSGYKTKALTLEEYLKTKGRVVPTSNYKFGQDLQPQMLVNGEVKRAQVIVPWNFRDENGNLLPMKNYMTDGMIDFNKLPEDLLKIQGFRIPTQGHNSMSAAEIVGFLPPGITDIIIAPSEYIAQMGSDFDVDKLYSYMKFFNVKENGVIEIVNEESKDVKNKREKVLINKIIEIHDKVLTYPDKRVQNSINKTLEYGLFGEGESLMKNLQDRLVSDKKGKFYFGASYQLNSYIGSAAAKSAVGIYSLASTFNSMLQSQSEMVLPGWNGITLGIFTNNSEENPINASDVVNKILTFGNLVGSTNLSSQKIAGSKRTKDDVISAFQSSALDEANQRILSKININNYTVNIPPTMAMFGFDEKVIATLLVTDIMRKNAHVLDFSAKDFNNYFLGLVGKNAIRKGLVIQAMEKDNRIAAKDRTIEYFNSLGDRSSPNYNSTIYNRINQLAINSFMETLFNDYMEVSIDEIENTINNPKAANYEYINLAVLYKLYNINKYGKSLSEYQGLVNLDSAGLKKTFLEVSLFNHKFQNLFQQNDPILDLLGEFSDVPLEGYEDVSRYRNEPTYYKPTKLASLLFFKMAKFGTENIFGDSRFSIYNTKSFSIIIDEIIHTIHGRDIHEEKAPRMSEYLDFLDSKGFRELDSAFIKYLLSSNKSLFHNDMTGHRIRLLHPETGLHSVIKNLSETTKVQYPFLKSLETVFIKGQNRVIFRQSAVKKDFDNSLIRDFESLYANTGMIEEIGMTTQELALDLIRYNFIIDPLQSATNFSRYISKDILKNIGIIETLKNFNFENEALFGINNTHISSFSRQFLQNNPQYIKSKNIVDTKSLEQKVLDINDGGENASLLPRSDTNIIQNAFVRSTDENGNIVLYQSTGNSFVKIPVLYNEYDSNVDLIQNSRLKKQKVNDFQYFVHTTPVERPPSVYRDRLSSGIAKMNLKGVVKEIMSNTSNTHHANLASIFLTHPLLKNVEIAYGNVPAGRTSYFDAFNLITINKKKFLTKDINTQERIVLHELIHAFTKRAITLPAAQLSPAQLSAVNKIKAAYNVYKNSIPEQELKDFIKKVEEHKSGEKTHMFTEEETSVIYAAINLEEFIAGMFSDERVQEKLDSIMLKKEKTLWETIVDLIDALLKAFGVADFTPENPLSRAVNKEILTVIKEEKNVVLPPSMSSTYDIKELTPDNPIFKLC